MQRKFCHDEDGNLMVGFRTDASNVVTRPATDEEAAEHDAEQKKAAFMKAAMEKAQADFGKASTKAEK